ncbi:unnamed protein product [Bubo scandiacus]
MFSLYVFYLENFCSELGMPEGLARNTGKQFANAKPREAPTIRCLSPPRCPAAAGPAAPYPPLPAARHALRPALLRAAPRRAGPHRAGPAGPHGIKPVLSRFPLRSEHAAHTWELATQNQPLSLPKPRFIQN